MEGSAVVIIVSLSAVILILLLYAFRERVKRFVMKSSNLHEVVSKSKESVAQSINNEPDVKHSAEEKNEDSNSVSVRDAGGAEYWSPAESGPGYVRVYDKNVEGSPMFGSMFDTPPPPRHKDMATSMSPYKPEEKIVYVPEVQVIRVPEVREKIVYRDRDTGLINSVLVPIAGAFGVYAGAQLQRNVNKNGGFPSNCDSSGNNCTA